MIIASSVYFARLSHVFYYHEEKYKKTDSFDTLLIVIREMYAH